MNPPAEAESLFTPRNFAAFLLVSLIWGGTWLVIRDQIASVPASWSISYRFLVASFGMFALAAMRRSTAGAWCSWLKTARAGVGSRLSQAMR